ncbi:MAG: DsbA family protein [Proteobacteria bacterium]|nr:DsbA family protein [Pseudomonadota bacterium]MDA1022349.1 DsbA family protein [Pseudomonadota bacterium]
MNRILQSLALLAVLATVPFGASHAVAGIVPVSEAIKEMALGSKDAPVTILEFSSLGCPHCANFHRETLPLIKKEYIDTGKVRLVFNDFPLGTPALAASMVAHCAGPKKFFGFIEIIFSSQAQWARSNNPLEALSKVARFGGMSSADVDACLKYEGLLTHIRQNAQAASDKYKVNSTPTFVINGEIVSGAQPFENFKKVIDKALAK